MKHCLGPVAARVALERLAEGFEGLSGACSCESCLGKACGRVWLLECEGHGRDKAGSTPPVVPGAAPALAKAGSADFHSL